ncbi:MAG TPA: prolipoprotein diacylglyceryl transferase [Verrucomicrobiae bacterium]|nr:prolipoprotein diacylglyceryl transferase [Verrucomicrobiae bacterium]
MKNVYWLLFVVACLAVIILFVIPAFNGRLLISPYLKVGDITFRFYGLIMAASVLLGYLIARNYSPRFGILKQEIDNFGFWLIIVAFLGARLYFVLFAWEYFKENPIEVVTVWHGGLSIYGAILSGLLFSFLWARKKAYGFRMLLDNLALGLPLAQALGRWGNFVNSEAFGLPTNLPWKMYVVPERRPPAFLEMEYFHPAFLYESLAMIAVFFILKAILGKVKPGVLAFSYLGLYSLVRFFVEQLRLDSVWIGEIRSDQLIAMIIVLISGIIILRWQFGLGQEELVEKSG